MTAGPADADVDRVLAHLASRPPTLGEGRLLCIDGPAGSGKTTLADAVARRTDAAVVHMDDLFPGWDGIRDAGGLVVWLLDALARGETGRYRRYDWHRSAYAEEHAVAPGPLLVLEGVASGSTSWAAHTTTLVWVEARRAERLRRGLRRDGEEMREHWLRWMRAEDDLHAEEATRARADLVFST